MIELSIPEYGRIPRSDLGSTLLRRLQSFDEDHSRSSGSCIFDWSHLNYIRVQNYGGVVQVPRLRIQILPKIDTSHRTADQPYRQGEAAQSLAQANLLYMLAFTRRIPIRERDLAGLRLQKLPLLEALLRIFVERLLEELRQGIEHAYVIREENSRFVRGKLLLSEHVRHNVSRKDRVFVAYDDFVPDIWLNRILKATCARLVGLTSVTRTQQRLQEATFYFEGVRDVPIRRYHFGKVFLSRNAERFRELLDFCWVVLIESSPAPSFGLSHTFSLLFPMETLFEEFIARFIKRYSEDFGLHRNMIHIQAVRRRRWLLRDVANHGKFQLKPDIVIDESPTIPQVIIDTKWKRLKRDSEDSKNGVSQADLYQLFAYAHRYESPDNVLLYPQVEGVTAKSYSLDGDDAGKSIRIELIDLNRDLLKEKLAFKADLQRIVSGA